MVKYDDTTFRKMRGEWVDLHNLTLVLGVIGPSASELEDGSKLTLAELALVHEYGTDTIPERSFLRSTLIARRGDLAALQVTVFKRVLARELTARAAMELIGEQCVSWIRAAIVAGIDPPLATETILRKSSTKPLIDHGQLYRAISYQVVDRKAGAASKAPEAAAA